MMNQTNRDVGIFILLPVLNERDNIGPLLDQIGQVLSNQSYTIGILDDGSTDGTLEYLERRIQEDGHHLHLIQQKKQGRGSKRGYALLRLLRWGLENTSHEIFIEMDGDLSHRPEELLTGIRTLTAQSYDVAIASKYLDGGQVVNRPLGRRLVSRICSFAVGSLITQRVRDYSNGFRFYSRAAAQIVSAYEIRYTSPIYLTEVLALWLWVGLKVGEFPTTYIGRNEGMSKLRLIDLVKASIAVFEVAVRYHLTGFQRRIQEQSSLLAVQLEHKGSRD